MSEYTRSDYKFDCIKLQEGLAGTRPIEHILDNYFKEYKGEKRRRLRMDIVNSLNGNSFTKAQKYNLMPIFKKVYEEKTGKAFT